MTLPTPKVELLGLAEIVFEAPCDRCGRPAIWRQPSTAGQVRVECDCEGEK